MGEPRSLDWTGWLLEQIRDKLDTQGQTLNNINAILTDVHDSSNGAIKSVVVAALPAGDNIIGRVKLTDGTNLLVLDTQGRLKSVGYAGYNIAKIMDAVTVGTAAVTSAVVDLREYSKALIIVRNSQDVDITVTVEISPDQTNWFTYRSDTLTAGDYIPYEASAIPAPYLRLSCVAAAAPTTGAVDSWAILKL